MSQTGPAEVFKSIPAVAPEQFAFAVQVAEAAATHRMPMKNPAEYRINLVESDGSVQHIGLTDRPENRALLAIKQQFKGEPDVGFAVMCRFWAYRNILRDARMNSWARSSGEQDPYWEIHSAVFIAAAEIPLNENGNFDSETFFQRVHDIAAAHTEEQLDAVLKV